MLAVEAQDVSKRFLLKHNSSPELKVRFLGLLHRQHRQTVEEFWALRNISLQIRQGEGTALVGRNGSGKSTFLKLIAAIHQPTAGRILVARGARICSMIELGIGFHPELTGRENVFLNAALHGRTRHQTEAIYDSIVGYSELQHFIDVPIKNYSSGMYMRLGFAIAARLEPDILLLDEIFAVGDADFQTRCVETLRGFMDQGKTIIFVSHAPAAVRMICRRTCVLDRGELAFDGDVDSGLAFYQQLLLGPSLEPPAPEAVSQAAGELASERDATPGWGLEFLRREGLQPQHRVLHFSGSDDADLSEWQAFLQEHHYVRFPDVAAVVQHAGAQETFDFVLADSVFSQSAFNGVARCIASVVHQLPASGRFYATWFENPDPASFESIVQSNGTTTYSDAPPFHYPFSLIANVCDAVGATVERVAARHPGGESILLISRRVRRQSDRVAELA